MMLNRCTDALHVCNAMRVCDAPMHVRTYELTHADTSKTEDISRVSDAHERTARIYLVEWPEFHFVKVGVTTCERWRGFIGRGGVLRYLTDPRSPRVALADETSLHAEIRAAGWPHAFTSKGDAAPFLGMKGAGWTECYLIGEPGSHRAALRERKAAS